MARNKEEGQGLPVSATQWEQPWFSAACSAKDSNSISLWWLSTPWGCCDPLPLQLSSLRTSLQALSDYSAEEPSNLLLRKPMARRATVNPHQISSLRAPQIFRFTDITYLNSSPPPPHHTPEPPKPVPSQTPQCWISANPSLCRSMCSWHQPRPP